MVWFKNDKEVKAIELLEKVGLDQEQIHRRILKLSGGQQQRVAIARALSYDSKIILADEPTGNLDPDTRDEIMDIFDNLKQQGKCIIIVTHSREVAQRADKVFTLWERKRRNSCAFTAIYTNFLQSIESLFVQTVSLPNHWPYDLLFPTH